MIAQHPLSGLGPEVFATTIGPRITGQHGINTHNLALNLATDVGLVGLGLGQIVDCFTYDYTFVTFGLFFASCYASAPRDSD